jgi:crooked neck
MSAPYGGGPADGGGGNTTSNLPRTVRVKNKAPAPRQITAEQILREAKEIKLEDDFRPPASVIADPQELAEYRANKRRQFEDAARRVGRWQPGAWAKYAAWEEAQRDFRRARSVWERALEVDYRNVSTWIKYAEMEMRHRFVQHARNVLDRAVTLLPRVDALWYRYAHMEEVLGNAEGVRQVFERWMRFEPDHAAWMAYVNVSFWVEGSGAGDRRQRRRRRR